MYQKKLSKAFKLADARIAGALATADNVTLNSPERARYKRLIDQHISELESSLIEIDEASKPILRRKISGLRKDRRKKRVDTLAMMYAEINRTIDLLRIEQTKLTKESKEMVYQNGFFMMAFAWYMLNGTPSKYTKEKMANGVDALLAGGHYVKRIWNDRMQNSIHRAISVGMKQGRTVAAIRRDVSRLVKTGLNNAIRLIKTEGNAANTAGSADASQTARYQLIAVLDNRTSAICAEMDTKTFLYSELKVGVTAPPFHPRCRTTIHPYTKDPATRQAWIDGKWETINFMNYYDYAEKYGTPKFKQFVNKRRGNA